MELLKRINFWISRLEQAILILLVLFMIFLAFLQVILRNFLDMGLLWGDPLLRNLVLWVGFIGASLATNQKRHINIDILGRLLRGRPLTAGQIAINLFSAVVCVILTRAAWQFVLSEKEFGTSLFANIPAWYFQSIIPVGFALMALRFTFLLVEDGLTIIKRQGRS